LTAGRQRCHNPATATSRRSLIALLLIVGCAATAVRRTPDTRYLGIMLDTRKLGASALERVRNEDPAVQAYVEQHGQPDFLVMPTPQDVELIYYLPSVLVQFHRPSPGAPSVTGTLTPLPNAVLNNLPSDIQAGTPGRSSDDPGADCWHVAVGGSECRTCCAGFTACVGSCKQTP
jgi:hypothetical protein